MTAAEPRICPKCGGEMVKMRWETQDQDTKGWVPCPDFYLCDWCGHEEKVKP